MICSARRRLTEQLLSSAEQRNRRCRSRGVASHSEEAAVPRSRVGTVGGPEKPTGADPSGWPARRGPEPAGEEPAILASPEVCLVLRPEQARSPGVDFAGHFPHVEADPLALEPDLSPSSQWPRHCGLRAAVTPLAGMWVLGIVTSAAPHTGGHPAPPWPVICIGQWPGHRARCVEVGKRTLWPSPSCRPRGQK